MKRTPYLLAILILLTACTGCDNEKLKPGEFEDAALKACVQDLIDYAIGVGTMKADDPNKYEKIDTLDCYGGGIKSLKGIENLSNLNWLAIVDNQVESLEPLSTLAKLTFLKLSNNKIKELESLSGLTELNNVSLIDNYIEDITPLYGCKKITMLSINGNCITDEKQFEDIQTQLPNAGVSGAVLAAQHPEKCQ